jgi:hypothetical protein
MFEFSSLSFRQAHGPRPAVICFEWLQRPENVLAGYVTWSSYRSKEHPDAIKILHHKTAAVGLHPRPAHAEDRLPVAISIDVHPHAGTAA